MTMGYKKLSKIKTITINVFLFIILINSSIFYTNSHAQLNENCVVNVLNRTSQVNTDGTWSLQNVPSGFGQVRVRATCQENGVTRAGQSDFIEIPANGSIDLPEIILDQVTPIPDSLSITSPTTNLASEGDTAQLTVTANFPSGTSGDVTQQTQGTSYTTSNTNVATISDDGLVTAVSSGLVIISALNEGALGLIQLNVGLAGSVDTDGDGIPDDIETANGLDPNNPADGAEDADGDGLTNKEELIDFGTMFQVADTDGDGIDDGEEVVAGDDGFITSPVLADTDGDGFNDSLEIALGSDPTDSSSFINLADVLVSLEVFPSEFNLQFNTVFPDSTVQLQVMGNLNDNSTIDLTSTRTGTNYSSSDLTICNFSGTDGLIFAGTDGSCDITITNNGFSTQSTINITTFTPVSVSSLSIPGFANSVDVKDSYAYVAAGSRGLQVVDVFDPQNPKIVAFQTTGGNANDVKVVDNYAYVARGNSGLVIIDISNSLNPSITGTIDLTSSRDIQIRGNTAYIADGSAGLRIINITDPANPTLIGTANTPGTAKGVDVNEDQTIAVVADATAGLQIIDISIPASPVIVGTVDTGDARDVVVRDNFAFVADFSSSFTSVDITDPALITNNNTVFIPTVSI